MGNRVENVWSQYAPTIVRIDNETEESRKEPTSGARPGLLCSIRSNSTTKSGAQSASHKSFKASSETPKEPQFFTLMKMFLYSLTRSESSKRLPSAYSSGASGSVFVRHDQLVKEGK